MRVCARACACASVAARAGQLGGGGAQQQRWMEVHYRVYAATVAISLPSPPLPPARPLSRLQEDGLAQPLPVDDLDCDGLPGDAVHAQLQKPWARGEGSASRPKRAPPSLTSLALAQCPLEQVGAHGARVHVLNGRHRRTSSSLRPDSSLPLAPPIRSASRSRPGGVSKGVASAAAGGGYVASAFLSRVASHPQSRIPSPIYARGDRLQYAPRGAYYKRSHTTSDRPRRR